MARIVSSTSSGAVERAVACLAAGGLVALPTETVYGLGADARNAEAVARIFAAKGRPHFNPLICHVCDIAMARAIADVDPLALALAESFWPGPLTLVLPARPHSAIDPLVQAGLATIAVRIPSGITRQIIAGLGAPVAAPSANRSGRVSPTTAAHVEAGLGDRINMIIDAGPATVGLESTIVRVSGDDLVLLRAGGIPVGALEAATGLTVRRQASGAAIEAPGQLASHYAPQGSLRLDADRVEPGEALIKLGRHRIAGEEQAVRVLDLSPSGDLREASSRLFAVLAELDRPDIGRIAVVPIPDEGLGEAINDRLRRAAAPRGDGS